MTNIELSIAEFCAQNNLPNDFGCNRIRGGRNSAVYRISVNQSSWILKHYFSYSGQDRSRLLTEYRFLDFLRDSKINNVASPIAFDKKKQLALYSFLPGSRLSEITTSHIEQAANFILQLYLLKEHTNADSLDQAVDACFTLNQHIDSVDIRIHELKESCNESQEFIQWLRQTLVPAWENLKHQIMLNNLSDMNERLTLSPSDFGFHNALEFNGRLSFVDFEYAGWDGISKLACDFICQPEQPVSSEQANYFLELLARGIHSDEFIYRVEALLPIHRLKWCCIMLNPFKNVGRLRLAHSGVIASDILDLQLNKAKSYFSRHLYQFQ